MKRVPVILQMTPIECGAACLSMVLTFYGRETTINECRSYLNIGRDGLSARTITQAARDLGLRVRAFSMEPEGLSQIQGPAIIHWEFSHFMVLEKWSPDGVQVVDPGIGRRRLSNAEFNDGFTGVVLTMAPGADFKQKQSAHKLTWRGYLTGMIRLPESRKLLTQLLGASALLQILGLIFPLFTLILVDYILPTQDASLLLSLGIGMIILVSSQVVLTYLRGALALNLEARLDTEVMLSFFEHVLQLPYRFFQERTSGDLLMRLGSIAIIREVLTGETVSAVLDAAMAIFYLLILFIWQPIFGILTLVFGSFQVILLLGSTPRLYELTERDLAAQAESQSYLVEALGGIGTLKSSASEDRAMDHWLNLFFKQLNISIQRSHLGNLIETGREGIGSFAPVFFLWIGGFMVLEGIMSLGTMLAVTTLAVAFLGPLSSLVSTGQQLQLIGANLDRITDVLQTLPEQDGRLMEPAPELSGTIEIRNISFRYHAHAPWAIRSASITIESGQKVAIVGRTGSGKSTLAMLLLGLYPLDEGEIFFDDQPLSGTNYRSLRRQFGVVLQVPSLFSGSIRDNISANDPNLSMDEIAYAADLAVIHDEIAALPMGYETIIAEGGVDLAGGQRQRLALARALAHRPSILLLDEATSDLDAITESTVDQNLSQLSCTRIVIAHRLSTVQNADQILVLNQGFVVERGTHRELLTLGGAYAELVHDQKTPFGSEIAG